MTRIKEPSPEILKICGRELHKDKSNLKGTFHPSIHPEHVDAQIGFRPNEDAFFFVDLSGECVNSN